MLRNLYRYGKSTLDNSLRVVQRRRLCDKKLQPAVESGDKNAQEHIADMQRSFYKPKNFERKLLVWVGRYKSLEEVPQTVSVQIMEKARNKARIKIANYMILATIIGCAFMVWSGKQAVKRGESVQKQNLDWHQAVKEGRA